MLMELSTKERSAGRPKDADVSFRNCLAALPDNGAESFGNLLRERRANSLLLHFKTNQIEIVQLRQQSVVAAEKLFKKGSGKLRPF